MTRIAKRMKMDGTANAVTKSANTSGTLLAARKYPKTLAPIKILKQVPVILPASSKLERIFFQVSRFRTIPIANAPKAPIPPPSVGVNAPMYMPPITTANRTRVAQTPLKEVIFSLQEVEGPGGPSLGLRTAR